MSNVIPFKRPLPPPTRRRSKTQDVQIALMIIVDQAEPRREVGAACRPRRCPHPGVGEKGLGPPRIPPGQVLA
jgi:hypothetical protein